MKARQLFILLTFTIFSTVFSSSTYAQTISTTTKIQHAYFLSGNLDAADAPGQPTAADGYTPAKKWDGKKVKDPNRSFGSGWPDVKGDVWVPTGPGGDAHGGPHWDVQTPGGGYRNVYPGGKVR
jgi:hypothetical protein